MSALRIVTGMGVDEFAEAVGRELGIPVPLYVYLEWEKDDGAAPPPRAVEAARDVALRNPIGAQASDLSRRGFLGGVIGLSTLAATGFPISARSLSGPSLWVESVVRGVRAARRWTTWKPSSAPTAARTRGKRPRPNCSPARLV